MIRMDPLFKGCTRPAMVFGVPIVPLGIMSGMVLLPAFWLNLLLIGVWPILLIVMRAIAAKDDQQFRLLFLKFWCRIVNYNKNSSFWNSSCYAPLAFKRRKVTNEG